jgi:hypothetical protein
VPARQRPVAGAVRAFAAADKHLRRAERQHAQKERALRARAKEASMTWMPCCSYARARLSAAEDEHAHAHAYDRRPRRSGHGSGCGERSRKEEAAREQKRVLGCRTRAKRHWHGQRRGVRERSDDDIRGCDDDDAARGPRRRNASVQSADRSATDALPGSVRSCVQRRRLRALPPAAAGAGTQRPVRALSLAPRAVRCPTESPLT